MSDEQPAKPVRLPWEDVPWVDVEASSQRAVAAASSAPGDPNSPVVQSYAEKAFWEETERVRNAPRGERNSVLFKAGANLYELVFAKALGEQRVDEALREACEANGYIRDDGEQAFAKTLASARRRGRDNPRDLTVVGTKSAYVHVEDITTEEAVTLPLNDFQKFERGFWTERDSLQNVYLAALSKMCSPWAVLAHCVSRVLALIPPHTTLPPIVGGRGSLNWFAAIAATSGGGKSSAATVARELVPNPILVRNLGSGEGMIDAYVRPANKSTGEPEGRHESVLFQADEIDGLTALGQRSGATLHSVLRSAFTGETLGFSYRNASDMHLEAHSYRMTLVLNAQPAKAGVLIGDAYGGTLQRFWWFPGMDSRITADPPSPTGTLAIPELSAWRYPAQLKVPYEAVELIRDERARAMRGEQDALDGHSLFIREKFAYGLTVLDGRSEMTLDDWRLAGTVSRISEYTRKWVAAQYLAAEMQEALDKGKMQGVSLSAAGEERSYQELQRLTRIASWVLKKLRDNGAPMTQRELSRAIASRDRSYLAMALERLHEAGSATRDKAGKWSPEQ